ncbi:MAG: bifunctional phosphoribosylaminoimidazolecarboxamide formyltransferase/inosine monophosphate cyclohydrolase [Myxococcaceae bacterium]|nr:MAG: bifunctional phosphoribosylaminoimidazolecarboxamide formyltransferase/inosine monophosphate cyclohydrolase [Myxococcaceae bacterium]
MLALLSVSDKRGLVPFAQGLVRLGYQLLSTGGTLEALKAAGIPATQVSEHTQSPEILGGRVKTLHPRIHGGILGRPDLESDKAEMAANRIEPISLVVVNLYPFRKTVASGAAEDDIIENIDIGGPAMVRASAKNFKHVAVVVDPDDYAPVLAEIEGHKAVGEETRRRLMRKAFAHTAAYDASISGWLSGEAQEPFPQELSLAFQKVQGLRYGENPHQRGAFYREFQTPKEPSVAFAKVLQGKELSYNNILDLDAALGLVLEFPEKPCAVVIKHNTPCGVAVDRAMAETFLEAVIAPSYSPAALQVLATKKNLRLLEAGPELASPDARPRPQVDARSVSGGMLLMDRDAVEPPLEWKVVSKRAPTPEEERALRFAWKVCKHVKSNAIVFAAGSQLLAQGGGQTNRVDSVRIAMTRGGEALKGSAVASDAFFPFRDGLDEAARAGATAVIQPGGSVRDAEVIAAADEHGMAMVVTGVRHFRH